jgi:hypothetical protein
VPAVAAPGAEASQVSRVCIAAAQPPASTTAVSRSPAFHSRTAARTASLSLAPGLPLTPGLSLTPSTRSTAAR